jgi:hypothetical protein
MDYICAVILVKDGFTTWSNFGLCLIFAIHPWLAAWAENARMAILGRKSQKLGGQQ